MASSESNKLAGQVALVTGAGKRLGKAIALHLAREGAAVVVHYNASQHEAQQVVEEIRQLNRRAIAVQADLASVAQIKQLFAQTEKEYGRLDILVNSAANFLHTQFHDTTEKIWDASMDVNLKAAFFCAQAAAPLLKLQRGCIINMADVGGILAWTGYIPHCVSKAGLAMLTRALAKELAPEIRVNAIAPGTISMPGDPPTWEPHYKKLAPLGRTGSPEDVTAAVSFLVNSTFMTGQIVVLDGGRTL